MELKRSHLTLALAAIVLSTAGCDSKNGNGGKSASADSATVSAPVPAEPTNVLARVYWAGKQHVSADLNAASLMKVWNLDESLRLEEQTLKKLSLAPWILLERTPDTNLAALLEPLTQDLLNNESCIELIRDDKGGLAFGIAIRLKDDNAALWQTNLATAFAALTGNPIQNTAAGWSLKGNSAPQFIELTRAGDWTILNVASAENRHSLAMAARLQQKHGALFRTSTNNWLEGELDLKGLAAATSADTSWAAATPRMSFSLTGDGQFVRTRGEIQLAAELPPELEQWTVPTNLIHEPIGSFAAVRLPGHWLPLPDFGMGNSNASPNQINQIFLWSNQGNPMRTYSAVPVGDPAAAFSNLTNSLLTKGNLWLATNGTGRLTASATGSGVNWKGVPFSQPFLELVATNGHHFITGGLIPDVPSDNNLPDDLVQQLFTRTNLLAYDWEVTGTKVEDWLRVGQLMRLMLHRSQLPAEGVTTKWFGAAAIHLGNSVTVVTKADSHRISFARGSTVGFTGAELHLIADWIESPGFPKGLFTLASENRQRLE